MKNLSLSFSALFFVFMIAALFAAFAGAWWHYFTAGGCLVLTIVLFNDFKLIKRNTEA